MNKVHREVWNTVLKLFSTVAIQNHDIFTDMIFVRKKSKYCYCVPSPQRIEMFLNVRL